jgi:hypothetical protein
VIAGQEVLVPSLKILAAIVALAWGGVGLAAWLGILDIDD